MVTPAARYLAGFERGASDECWPWTRGQSKEGYGRIKVGGKTVKAHRFGFELLVRPLSDGELVCHSCDNPPCQNPAHWFAGTPLVNMQDKVTKGRHVGARPRAAHPRAKLTEAEIDLIRASTEPQRVVADRFGISQAQVSRIVRHKRWA